jgi:hypothetical protein
MIDTLLTMVNYFNKKLQIIYLQKEVKKEAALLKIQSLHQKDNKNYHKNLST